MPLAPSLKRVESITSWNVEFLSFIFINSLSFKDTLFKIKLIKLEKLQLNKNDILVRSI